MQVDELIDLAVRIAGEIGEGSPPGGFLTQAMNGHDREELLHRPVIRYRLEHREVTEVRIGQHPIESFLLSLSFYLSAPRNDHGLDRIRYMVPLGDGRSGTQIIAAEQLGRACWAMELSPAFVDVALRRWERATGNEAVLDGTAQTFAQVALERGTQ